MPTVTVIIPAFNPGRFLEIAAQSVIAQTYRDWELIIIDDGGHEDLSHILLHDDRIRVVKQQNRGTSAARNTGVLLAKGELVAFLDHDDYWYPEKLEDQVRAMASKPTTALCYTGFDLVDSNGRKIGNGYSKKLGSYIEMIEGVGGPCLSTAIVRKECLASVGLFDPMYLGIQDYDVFLKLARFFEVEFIARPLAAYRLHENNASRKYMMVYREIQNVAHKHWAMAIDRKDARAISACKQLVRAARPTYGAQAFDQARECLKQRKIGEFLVHVCRASRLSPGYVMKSLVRFKLKRVKIGKQHLPKRQGARKEANCGI